MERRELRPALLRFTSSAIIVRRVLLQSLQLTEETTQIERVYLVVHVLACFNVAAGFEIRTVAELEVCVGHGAVQEVQLLAWAIIHICIQILSRLLFLLVHTVEFTLHLNLLADLTKAMRALRRHVKHLCKIAAVSKVDEILAEVAAFGTCQRQRVLELLTFSWSLREVVLGEQITGSLT